MISDFSSVRTASNSTTNSFCGRSARDYVATGKVRMAYINFPLPTTPERVAGSRSRDVRRAPRQVLAGCMTSCSSQDAWEDQHTAAHAIGLPRREYRRRHMALDRCVSQHASKALIDADADRPSAGGRPLDSHGHHRQSKS